MTAPSRRQQLQELLALEPNDPFLRYGLAMEQVGEGNDEEALFTFQELRALAADYVPAYQQEGQALMRLGRVDEARGIFEKGIAVARRQGNAHATDEMQGFIEAMG